VGIFLGNSFFLLLKCRILDAEFVKVDVDTFTEVSDFYIVSVLLRHKPHGGHGHFLKFLL
jgi:hypothetical protein